MPLGDFFPRKIKNFVKKIILWSKARKDYQLARGYFHMKILLKIKPKTEKDLKNLENEISNLKNFLQSLNKNREVELQKEATRFLVHTSLNEIEGIGPTLQKRILVSSFFGKLEDLRFAKYRVEGIGEEKQKRINKWIYQKKAELNDLVKNGDFPKKKEILERFLKEEEKIKKEIRDKFKEKEKLWKKYWFLLQELKWLKEVKPKDFFRSYFGENSEKVEKFLIGIFPEWGKMPEWLKELISKYGN